MASAGYRGAPTCACPAYPRKAHREGSSREGSGSSRGGSRPVVAVSLHRGASVKSWRRNDGSRCQTSPTSSITCGRAATPCLSQYSQCGRHGSTGILSGSSGSGASKILGGCGTWALRSRHLYAQKADIARYEVVHRFGGVYLDTDMECLRPLDDLISDHESSPHANTTGSWRSASSATPRHPVLIETIERLPASSFFHRGEPIYVQTGPILLDKVLRDGRWRPARSPHLPARVLLSVRRRGTLASR